MAGETAAPKRGRKKQVPSPAASASTGGTYVVLRVDEMGDAEGGVGERLTVVAVLSAESSERASREYKARVEAEWRELRAKGGDLPDVFPRHLYRCVTASSWNPGYKVEEERQSRFGTW